MRKASSGKEDAFYAGKIIFDAAPGGRFPEAVWVLLCLYKQIIATPYVGTGIPSRHQQDVTRAISAAVRHYDAVRPTRHVIAAGGGVRYLYAGLARNSLTLIGIISFVRR